MKNSLHLYKTDMKNTMTNWVAAILIGGLMILPSLYAWMNIEASWDPYGQTDQIKVGVVNKDTGASVRDEDIHVGNELVETLKDNNSMDWQFVDEKKAMDKLEYGDYFAVIEVPEDFSEKLATVISGQPEKAEVEYYVNEKINAIAPKITDKGATVIVEEISSSFISTVNGVIFDMFNQVGIELENSQPDIIKFEDYIFTIEEKLPEIKNILDESLADAENAEGMISDANSLIPKVEGATNQGLSTVNETLDFIHEAEGRLDEIAPRVNEDLDTIQQAVQDTNEFLDSMDLSTQDLPDINQQMDNWNEQIDSSIASIETIEEILHQVQDEQGSNQDEETEGNADENTSEEGNQEPDGDTGEEPNQQNPDQPNNQEQIENALNQLTSMKATLQDLQEQLNQADEMITENNEALEETMANLKETAQFTNERLDAFITEYKETIEPRIKEEIQHAKSSLESAKNILTEIQQTIPEAQEILNRTATNLTDGEDLLESVLAEYPYINTKINELADKIRSVEGKTDLSEMIELLQNDPDAERNFFEEPVMLNQNKLFPIENYGTGMTPFYTILAIWVGGLLLISLLATDPHHGESYTGRQIYFGRLFTFITIGFVQTLIVTVGDMYLLGVEIKEPIWFILFGLLSSVVFILIVYTLVSVFGDIGKALAIVFLVLQIAGAGGTYPVDLLPEFFQAINPFLPFTYAISLMREAVGGIVWSRVQHDAIVLSMFGLVALLVGALFKARLNKYTHKLMKKSRETGLFH
ncbi:putative membrane protein [Gracilibacillus orientalis]|uniref:Putative membrane protein n=2 Tax=Gracilibacillus orientalis TaxID=334253 RepID=A0A1I4Q141_9BACI|nr:YhgE/Pip domain-containing protein [Gracilibacillus orientalis]SFM33586.1 putative membrane protein [Gracilibacillus orientalis]